MRESRTERSHLMKELSIVSQKQRVGRVFLNPPLVIIFNVSTLVRISCNLINLFNASDTRWVNRLLFFEPNQTFISFNLPYLRGALVSFPKQGFQQLRKQLRKETYLKMIIPCTIVFFLLIYFPEKRSICCENVTGYEEQMLIGRKFSKRVFQLSLQINWKVQRQRSI